MDGASMIQEENPGRQPRLQVPVILAGYPYSGRTFLLEELRARGFICLDGASLHRILDFFREHAGAEKLVAVLDTGEEAQGELIAAEYIRSFPPPVLVFLEAGDSVLLERRIAADRTAGELKHYLQLLEPLRARAALFLNSGYMPVQEEADRVIALTESRPYRAGTVIHIRSFGFLYGPPPGDVVIDVRFLPNPYYVYSLRSMTGQDEKCAAYVFGFECSHKTLESLEHLTEIMFQNLLDQGRSVCTICIGCTGGQHRSVAMAEALGRSMQTRGYPVTLSHREEEAGRWPKK
ncbi:nucleotide-binding protein [Spirochaetia bacterium]|nr:nucleotide-binding protein [Spirochaetia bacterium]